MNKKRTMNMLAICLSAIMLMNQGNTAVYAADTQAGKEEVIYAMLSGDGSLKGAYVVNSFTDKDIVDYGNYINVKNLNTTDAISYEDGKITIHTEADKLYYQGDLDAGATNLPWDISIRYFMDGKEYTSDEIAGMTGALKITIDINRNKYCDSSFWKNYALQATVLLDTNKCKNIVSEGATQANVGSDKQLSYIILPKKGDTIEITADVTEFEMQQIAINGVRLNLNVDIDTDELTDKIEEIQDAVAELDDGVGDLDDGIEKVESSLIKLDSKSYILTDGSKKILQNLKKIKTALSDVKMDKDSITKLAAASKSINSGIGSLVKGLNSMDDSIGGYYRSLSSAGLGSIDDFVNKHNQAVSALGITDTGRKLYQAYTDAGNTGLITKLTELVKGGDSEAVSLYQRYQASGDISVLSEYVTGMAKLIGVENLLKADISYIQGSDKLISGIDEQLDNNTGALMTGAVSLRDNYSVFNKKIQKLTGTLNTLQKNMVKLKKGINELVNGYEKLDTGINSYTDGVNKILGGYKKLEKGSGKLVSGADEFFEKTEDMDSEMEDKIDKKIDDMTGSSDKTISFVSDKNTNVNSVLFVIKTPEIKMPAEEKETPAENEKTSIFTKFLNLFKFK